jgi:hypothetical protein
VSRARDGGLGAGLLGAVALLAIAVDASIEGSVVLCGIATTIVLEVVAYRRPTLVREQFERRSVVGGSMLLVVAVIAAGTLLAPDRVLSLMLGAVGTYLALLVTVAISGSSPRRPT